MNYFVNEQIPLAIGQVTHLQAIPQVIPVLPEPCRNTHI